MDISKRIEECVISSTWIKSETEVFDEPEIFRIVNKQAPYEFMNGIYRTNFKTAEQKNEVTVKELHKSYQQQKISFRWYVYPHSQPQDLATTLEKLKPTKISEMAGLYLESKDYPEKLPPHVTVEELNEDNLNDYAETVTQGWQQTGNEAEQVKREIKKDFDEKRMPYRAFLARYKGEPASTGIFRIVGANGYLMGGSTRPEFRGKGVYKGLVSHRLKILKENNIHLTLILTRKATSAPICLKLGFKLGCECKSFDFIFA